MVRAFFCLLAGIALLAMPNVALAQNVIVASEPSQPPEEIDAGAEIDRLITAWVLESIPHDYADDKKWGTQVDKHTKLRLRRDPGGKLETYREKELVNHGDWSKYTVRLRDPQQALSIQLKNIQARDDGRMGLEIHITANLDIDGRVAKWSRGVQLYSIGAEGNSKVRLVVGCSLATHVDIRRLPPDLVIDPIIESTDIIVDEFRLNHVGKFGGEVAQQVTRATRKLLDEKIAEKEVDLVAKLNKKIVDNKDKLRISTPRLAEFDWATNALPFLLDNEQKPITEKPAKEKQFDRKDSLR